MTNCAIIVVSPDVVIYALAGLTTLLLICVALHAVVNIRR